MEDLEMGRKGGNRAWQVKMSKSEVNKWEGVKMDGAKRGVKEDRVG